MQKREYLAAIFSSIALIGASIALFKAQPVIAQTQGSAAVFTSDGKLQIPKGFRRWVFVGAPLTPNGLNGGKANFPEFHNVYIQAQNVEAYMKTGQFPEGTVIVKELTRLLNPTFPDGSRNEASGRGFFNGEFNGIDLTVKDSKRFAKTNGWGFFSFGHHPEPYEATPEEKPVSECAGCHMANVAKTDMTWVQFYPLLLGRTGSNGWDTPRSR
jgi:Cytochrome P460